jgi:hypothetical protein
MNLTLTKHVTRHKVAIPEQRPRPTYWTDEIDGRTDLRCTVCGRAMAHGVDPSRVAADAPFFVEAHVPFCMGRH